MMMMLMMRKAKDIDNAQWKSALDVGGHKNEHIINYYLEKPKFINNTAKTENSMNFHSVKQSKNGLQSQSGCHGLPWMTFMDNCTFHIDYLLTDFLLDGHWYLLSCYRN